MSLKPGLYDQPVTARIDAALQELADELQRLEPIDSTLSARAFAQIFVERLIPALESLPREGRVEAQLAVVNRLLAHLRDEAPDMVEEGDLLVSPGRVLRAVLQAVEAPRKPSAPNAPRTPLSISRLLVNGQQDLSVGPEIKRELLSSDRVDLLCSFLKWSGLRLVEAELRELCQRGALRVLTTAYMGATERRALDALVDMGAELKVSYDTARTRLHAKAWLFHRESGFSTATIGSSNLSSAAMLDGVEWNVRVSQVDNGMILEKFHKTFEQYWRDPVFRAYDPGEFSRAVTRGARERLAPYVKLDVQPRQHQQEILDALEAERSRGHMRNLVVAATGTGKTIVAALDYKRLRRTLPRDRLLFVAHRREILQQSLATFQTVCRDGGLGELLTSGLVPTDYEHVFASVQSLHADRLATFAPDYFDVVIVDEFHHAAAPTYEALLAHVKPKVLLGLTATPERADGKTVLGHFDGRIASELRLWKALDQDLLCPFQYFGLGNAPDISGVRWSGGRYNTSELSRVYTSDHLFAKRVLQETSAKVLSVHEMRALGFCVDVAHAEFMARCFRDAGIGATAVSAKTPAYERKQALSALQSGEINIVFSVDLFNEGVDLPNVDTLLFLRPTESATIFLQQLGRGLRLASDKACCTVLDFIGGAHRKFRFDERFRALLGGTRRSVERQIEEGFPRLPNGCFIELDRQAQQAVLRNIRQAVGRGRKPLIDDLEALGDVSLATFLAATAYELEDVYDGRGSFSDLRRACGFETSKPNDQELAMERALGRMIHLDDFERISAFQELLKAPPDAAENETYQRLLFVLLADQYRPFGQMGHLWSELFSADWIRRELTQLLEVLGDRCRRLSHPGLFAGLRDHATYNRAEIFAAIDQRTKRGGVKKIVTGVYHAAELHTDLFFVTLEKTESGFTATTMYQDYPMNPSVFHWESQSGCHEDTAVGRRYLRIGKGKDRALLFVRQAQKDERGVPMPYINLGTLKYRRHTGGRPMQIEWELDREMPAEFYQWAKLAAG